MTTTSAFIVSVLCWLVLVMYGLKPILDSATQAYQTKIERIFR